MATAVAPMLQRKPRVAKTLDKAAPNIPRMSSLDISQPSYFTYAFKINKLMCMNAILYFFISHIYCAINIEFFTTRETVDVCFTSHSLDVRRNILFRQQCIQHSEVAEFALKL